LEVAANAHFSINKSHQCLGYGSAADSRHAACSRTTNAPVRQLYWLAAWLQLQVGGLHGGALSAAAAFKMVDAAALFAALLVVAAVEDGTRAAARVLLLAPLASPTVALYLAEREHRVAGIIEHGDASKAA
jgi:hypothetical protein